MKDDEIVLTPPDAAKVAQRALALSALSCRGFIDKGAGDPEAESVRARVVSWVEHFNLKKYLSSYEWDTLTAPLGSLEQQRQRAASWACEGLAVLAWALGRFDLPRHDTQVDPYELTDALSFLGNDADEIVKTATLRSPGDLRAYRELMYAIHCRLLDFLRNRRSCDFTKWIENDWLAALGIDSGRIIVQGDLKLEDMPVVAYEGDLAHRLSAISEHHRASVWLVGEFVHHWDATADT